MGSGSSAAKYREDGQPPAVAVGRRVLHVNAAVRGGDRRSYRDQDAFQRRLPETAPRSTSSVDGAASTTEGPPSNASRAATPLSLASGGSISSKTYAIRNLEPALPTAPSFGHPPLPPGTPPCPFVRKPWASSKIGTCAACDLPPLRPPSSHSVGRPQAAPPENYITVSPIARMAAEYWKYEGQSKRLHLESSSQ
mmetsp:Transcript_115214/g.229512  ORF Transcript_115214/g.229512 Transcript_115214/m.229512 type:complete len:195 (+) Transcript_115214:159-743(+)